MAPKKRSGSGASKQSKKKKPTARAADSSDDGDDMEEEPDGPSHEGKVTFGAQFMLFRVLMLGGVSVSFARSAGNVAKILSAAARQGATRRVGLAMPLVSSLVALVAAVRACGPQSAMSKAARWRTMRSISSCRMR